MRVRVLAVLVVTLVVLAGCAEHAPRGGVAPSTPDGPTTEVASETDTEMETDADPETATPAPVAGDRPDPPTDRLGWEAGLWYDDPVSVTTTDGYNDTELDRVVARTMARVEHLRDREFTESVDVRVISRSQYRESTPFGFEEDPFEDAVFESLFVVGENDTVADAYEAIYGGSVQGYYAGGDIVVVSDDPNATVIDRGTLAHELVHALQDQHEDLGFPRGQTRDARAAGLSVSEGDANYVMDRYQDHCREEWECLAVPNASDGSGGPINRGLFLTVFFPYSDGPSLVGALRDRGGWAAVDRLYAEPPASTEQVIHPERYPDDEPTDVSVPDRSAADWEPFGPDGGETVGEMGVFTMFWSNGVVNESSLFSDPTRYNYSHPASAGWDGDRFVSYRNGDRTGYVWATTWDTDRDARQFQAAYADLLESKGAVEVRPDVYRLPDGSFADAFRITREDTTVTVVNAPAVDELDAVHAAR